MKCLLLLCIVLLHAIPAFADISFKGRKPNRDATIPAGNVQLKVKIRLTQSEVRNDGILITEGAFQLQDPSGVEGEWLTGNALKRNARSRAFRFKKKVNLQISGAWQWRVRGTDSIGREKISGWSTLNVTGGETAAPVGTTPAPVTSPTTSAPVGTPTTGSPVVSTIAPTGSPVSGPPPIAAARNAIEDLVNVIAGMKAKFVRLGFHDCVGGCDGCVDLNNLDNKGLDIPIDALEPIVSQYAVNGLTKADIWALAAAVGADTSQRRNRGVPYNFNWYGRPVCNENSLPARVLPPADITTEGIVHFFRDEFGFSPRQTAALMGAHSIGTLSREHSGFTGNRGWDNNNRVLDSNYYNQLIGGEGNSGPVPDFDTLYDAPNWNKEIVNNGNNRPIPDRQQWVRNRNQGGRLIMTNADIALVRDFSNHFNEATGEVSCEFKNPRRNRPACPHAAQTFFHMAEFRFDEAGWFVEFRDVYMKVLHHGSNVEWDACSNPPCKI